jgi:hypothetical protein
VDGSDDEFIEMFALFRVDCSDDLLCVHRNIMLNPQLLKSRLCQDWLKHHREEETMLDKKQEVAQGPQQISIVGFDVAGLLSYKSEENKLITVTDGDI